MECNRIYADPEHLSYRDIADLINLGDFQTFSKAYMWGRTSNTDVRYYECGGKRIYYVEYVSSYRSGYHSEISRCGKEPVYSRLEWTIPIGECNTTYWWRSSRCNEPCKLHDGSDGLSGVPFGSVVWSHLCDDARNSLLGLLFIEEIRVLFSRILTQEQILTAFEKFIPYSVNGSFKTIWDEVLSEQQREYIFSGIKPESKELLFSRFTSLEKKNFLERLSLKQQVKYFVFDIAEAPDFNSANYTRISFWRIFSDITRQNIAEELDRGFREETLREYGIEMYLCSNWVELKYRDTIVYKVCIRAPFLARYERREELFSKISADYKYNLVNYDGKLISEKWFDEDVDVSEFSSTGIIKNVMIDGKCYCWYESKGFYPADLKWNEACCSKCNDFQWKKDIRLGVYGYCKKKNKNVSPAFCCIDISLKT